MNLRLVGGALVCVGSRPADANGVLTPSFIFSFSAEDSTPETDFERRKPKGHECELLLKCLLS